MTTPVSPIPLRHAGCKGERCAGGGAPSSRLDRPAPAPHAIALAGEGRVFPAGDGISPRQKKAPSTTLESLALGPDAEAQTVVELPLRSPELLVGADGLWLVGESEVARWDGTEL
jgi:hypothetical protein